MKCRKFLSLALSVGFLSFVLSANSFAQDRQRIVTSSNIISSETSTPKPTKNPVTRPVLTTPIRVFSEQTTQKQLVKKTVSATPITSAPSNSVGNSSAAVFTQRLLSAMRSKIGLPYIYGSDGPGSYDCSGLVWSVFQSAGLQFDRTSAASYYRTFEPVSGDERYKFGTLVFFNGLGHVGIVIDENTFYHASQSKGVTFSKFAGYWEKRVVGFRRIPTNTF